jgi:prepilin-type N-terminal cleavage/methylation domain-containing protein/prepilin-type processing-associated H-X9-DG protein
VKAFTLIELLVVIAIIAILIGFFLGPYHPDMLLQFFFGWALFLYRVLREMRLSTAGVLTALVCLALLAGGLHLFLGWLYGQAGETEGPRWRWRKRWTATMLAGVVLMFVAGISAVGITHQTVWLFNSPEPLTESRGGIRSLAARTQSQNNLKQMALATCDYAEAHDKVLPPGSTFDRFGTPLHSWQTLILPYIEQEALFKTIKLDRPWNDPVNADAMRTRVKNYLHPLLDDRPAERGFALSHYAGNVRVLGGNSGQPLDRFPDGLSNTILVGEAAGNYRPWGHPLNLRDPALGLHRSPNGFGGPAREGTNFAFADGSVRLIRNDIDPKVLKALSTPDGGEVISEDY